MKNSEQIKNKRFYLAKKANEKLAKIAKKISQVPVPSEGCDWADIGDLEHINSTLSEIVDCFA